MTNLNMEKTFKEIPKDIIEILTTVKKWASQRMTLGQVSKNISYW